MPPGDDECGQRCPKPGLKVTTEISGGILFYTVGHQCLVVQLQQQIEGQALSCACINTIQLNFADFQ